MWLAMTQYFEFREIFVKTVCGEGDESVTEARSFHPNHVPTKILGTEITDTEYRANYVDGAVVIKGTYGMNIWYAYNDCKDTALLTVPVEFEDTVRLSRNECSTQGVSDVRVWNTYGPRVVKAEIHGKDIAVTCVRTWRAEVIGEAALCVKVYPGRCDSDDKGDTSDDFAEDEYLGDEEIEVSDEDYEQADSDR